VNESEFFEGRKSALSIGRQRLKCARRPYGDARGRSFISWTAGNRWVGRFDGQVCLPCLGPAVQVVRQVRRRLSCAGAQKTVAETISRELLLWKRQQSWRLSLTTIVNERQLRNPIRRPTHKP